MPKTILVIEDNSDIRDVVTSTLESAGYQTVTADSGMSGLTRVREAQPDLVLLDLGLPDFDGSEITRRLRRNHHHLPVIVLSAMDAVDRKLELLNGGADDYLTKPFNPDELVARIQVQFRKQDGPGVVKLGPLEVHPAARRVCWNGQLVPLSPKEFDVFAVIARQPGRVVSRDQLMSEVWKCSDVRHCNLVDVHVANLRARFREVGAYRVVRTARGVGFGLYTDLQGRSSP